MSLINDTIDVKVRVIGAGGGESHLGREEQMIHRN